MKKKYAELDALLREEVPPIVAFVGNEDFLRREGAARVLEKIHGGPPRDEDVDRLRGKENARPEQLVQLFDDLRTPSLFASERSVIVEDAEALLAADPEAWVGFLGEPWSGGTLILLCESLDARRKVSKAIGKRGWWIEVTRPFHRPPPWQPHASPWENDLNRWLVARAGRHGLELDPAVAHLLMTRVGTSLGDLAGALERLATVLNGHGTITRELAEKHTPEGEESSVFELVDAFFAGDRRETLRLARELLNRGSTGSDGGRITDPSALLLLFVGASLKRIRQLREVQRTLAAGGGEAEILKNAGVARPFLPRLRAQSRATPPERIPAIVSRLRQADRDLKTGRGAPAELLERIVVSGAPGREFGVELGLLGPLA